MINYRKIVLDRCKERYALARSLGFDGYQAQVMAHWSEKRIRAAAEEYFGHKVDVTDRDEHDDGAE